MAEHASASSADELLITRLLPPPLRPALVDRPRLRAALRAGLAHALTVIVAPAGFGKTTLLAQALTQGTGNRGQGTGPDWNTSNLSTGEASIPVAAPAPSSLFPVPSAWLALDDGDNDPARFWRYLLAALARAVPDAWLRAEALLRATAAAPAEPLVVAILNAAAELPHPLVLVMDDYHLIDTPAIHAGVALIAERAPPQLRLLLASRTPPPLPLERLRVRGQLAELGAEQLRFTAAEAAALLGAVMGLQLAPAVVAELTARTEGWGAGLILAALAAKGHAAPERFAASFGGASPAVLDYIVAEVLGRQPPALRAFLLATAALDQLSPELCDAVVAERVPPGAPSAALLAQLERANLFLVPLDDSGRRFRYHQLFAEALRHHLALLDPEALRATRRRAATWLAAHGAPAEALEYALAAQDWPHAAALLGAIGRTTMLRGEVATVRGWLAALPPAVLLANQRLLLLDGWVRVLLSELDRAAQRAAAVGDSDPELRDEARLLATMVAILRGSSRLGQPLTHADADAPPTSSFLRTIAALNAGFVAQFAGDVHAALRAFEAAERLGAAEGNALIRFLARCQIGELQLLQGRPRAAIASYEQAQAIASAVGPQAPFAGTALVGLGAAAYEQGDFARAAELIDAGLSRASVIDLIGSIDGQLRLASIAALRGEPSVVEAHLRAAEAVGVSLRLPVFAAFVAAQHARLAVIQGNLAAAAAWLAAPAEQSGLAYDDSDLSRAIVLRALGRHAEALLLAERIVAQATHDGRGRHVVDALLVRAQALAGLGQHEAARQAIAAAHALARPEGLVAPFLELGVALPPPDSPPLLTSPDALTERELDVLRLIATGLDNGAIAARLVVAPSTVKKHVNRIFAKLGATSRTQALVRARARGLLS